ncbi:nuclear transport factor 2 family protein [Oculatella sp. LEGE 06141]|nr:nuclear transport factor 2 family protein [Oculatella sp. LEGE 06141]
MEPFPSYSSGREASHHTLTVALQGFAHFSQGLATGNWDEFIEMLTDDFTFWFPTGAFHGMNVGKERAIAFFNYVSDTFNEGLSITLDRVTSNETTVVFEFRDEGKMRGEVYKNRVAVSFDVRDNQICGYREYFGSNGTSN